VKKVVIIGAGPAGLTAAVELLKEKGKYKVTILEESNSIGGISRTVNHNGNRMDIGGHRFFSKDKDVVKWWNDLLPTQGKKPLDYKKTDREVSVIKGGPDPDKTDKVMLIRNRISRIYYKKKFFDYPVSLKWETIKNMGFFTTMVAGFSYLKSCVFKKDDSSLANFYINRFGKKLYSMFFEGYTEKLWGRDPKDISSDWGAQRVKGLSIRAVLKDMLRRLNPNHKKSGANVETSLIEEFMYPKYGPGQLWELAAEKIEKQGGIIKKEHRVKNFNLKDGKIVSVVVETKKGEAVIEGDIFISTMPIKDLINGLPSVPSEISRVANGLPYRDFVTIGVLLDKLNLKNKTKIKTLGNIIPDTWLYVQDVGVKLGRIQIFNNWSCYMVKEPENKVWIGLEYFCNEGDDFWKMTDEECLNLAKSELVKMGVIDKDAIIYDSHREKVKKAYPAYFDTYYEMDKIVDYLDEYDNLYCIGRNGQHRYNNMDHSMVTAFETVKNIKTGNKNRDNIWNVNTEKEYHEERKK